MAPLPLDWVEAIFRKLVLTYGHAFLSRWDGLDLAAVKDDWARELAGLARSPDAIAWGLAHLPEGRAPTVLEFRALCVRRPSPNAPQLYAPPAHAHVRATALAGLRGLLQGEPRPGGRDLRWARQLVARAQAGEAVGHYALKAAHAALGMP